MADVEKVASVSALVERLQGLSEPREFRIETVDQPYQTIFEKCQDLQIFFERRGPNRWLFKPDPLRHTVKRGDRAIILLRGLVLFGFLLWTFVIFRSPLRSCWRYLEDLLNGNGLLTNLVAAAAFLAITLFARRHLYRALGVFLGFDDAREP